MRKRSYYECFCATIIIIALIVLGAVAHHYNTERKRRKITEHFLRAGAHTVEQDLAVPEYKPVFAGDSKELKATRIVATLDEPLTPGANLVWCASFEAAWKALEDMIGEPPKLEPDSELATTLNRVDDLRPAIPPSSLYATAGWVPDGIIQTITDELTDRFPTKQPPIFPGITPDSFLAYAYMEALIPFSVTYLQNKQPLHFRDSNDVETQLRSFGVYDFPQGAEHPLLRQPCVLYQHWNENGFVKTLTEYAVDLDRTSDPHQIVLAMIPPADTLAETVASVQEKIAAATLSHDELSTSDKLLVPDIMWEITHDYDELIGKEIVNEGMDGQFIDVAQQESKFRLDCSGVTLQSQASIYMMYSSEYPAYYIFDRPFLIYIQSRETKIPYFAMWVDNAELLCKWEE